MGKKIILFMIVTATIHSASFFAVAGLDDGVAAYNGGDYVKAYKEFKESAALGNASAQYRLGSMYDEGQGMPKDSTEAANWYRRAADQGNASAQYSLGLMYARGDGVPKDYFLAYMWFDLAAAQGNDRARKYKNTCATQLTLSQIAEAERLAREWKPSKE
jgi:uncharacterized protein